jgi:hypothetical protein
VPTPPAPTAAGATAAVLAALGHNAGLPTLSTAAAAGSFTLQPFNPNNVPGALA